MNKKTNTMSTVPGMGQYAHYLSIYVHFHIIIQYYLVLNNNVKMYVFYALVLSV